MRDVVERLGRRIMMALACGRLTTGDDSGVIQRHQVKLGADEVRDGTPRVAEYGLTSMPHPGAESVVVFIGGNRDDGVIIATGDQRYRLRSLVPGEVALYDDLGQVVHLKRDGITVRTPGIFRVEAADIQLHATNSYRFDVNGHGQHWHPTTIDTYQIGESAGTSNPINPPEIV